MSRAPLIVLASHLAAAGCVAPAQGAPAPSPAAWNRVVLLELYTSQGCSSCPPADAFVRELPRAGFGRDKVIPLTFHVDYWDRLGWPDPFAATALTARQEWYAKSRRLRGPGEGGAREIAGLYTPQMIVDGQVHFPGGQGAVAVAEIRRAGARPAAAELSAKAAIDGQDVIVTVQIAARPGLVRAGDWRLVVALAAKTARTHVLHGENGGETLEEASVVRTLSERMPLGFPPTGEGSRTLRVRLRKPTDLSWAAVEAVAFVQEEQTREVAAVTVVGAPS